MKIQSIIAILICLPLVIYGQHHSSVDFIVGIDYSYRSLSLTPQANLPIDITASRNSRETAKKNWRIGFNYNKRLSNKLFIKSGVRLASVGYKGEKLEDLRWPSEITNEGYMPDPSLPSELQQFYDFWFLEIPIIARYEFNAKQFAPFLEIGISPSIYLTSRTKSVTNLSTDVTYRRGDNVNDYSNIHLVGTAAVGANYNLSARYQVFGQATFRRHFTSLVNNTSIDEFLYNGGIEFGVRLRIG